MYAYTCVLSSRVSPGYRLTVTMQLSMIKSEKSLNDSNLNHRQILHRNVHAPHYPNVGPSEDTTGKEGQTETQTEGGKEGKQEGLMTKNHLDFEQTGTCCNVYTREHATVVMTEHATC